MIAYFRITRLKSQTRYIPIEPIYECSLRGEGVDPCLHDLFHLSLQIHLDFFGNFFNLTFPSVLRSSILI